MFEYLWDRIERWLSSQVKSVVRDTMSPAVMQRAMDALRTEFKNEMKAYRRQKEEEMAVFMRKHDHLISTFGKTAEIINNLKFTNKALERALRVCAPPEPGKLMTEIEIRQLLDGIEANMVKDGELESIKESGIDVSDELLHLLDYQKAPVGEGWKLVGIHKEDEH